MFHNAWSRTLSALMVVAGIIAVPNMLRPVGMLGQQANNPSEQVRALNNQLLQVYARLNSLPDSGAAAVTIRDQGAETIRQRADALQHLIQNSPSQALSLAFSEDVLSRLRRAFPDAVTSLESTGSWQGTLESLIEDGADLKTYRKRHSITVGDQTLNVHFASQEPTDLQSGNTIRVTGIRVGTEVAADGATVTGTVTGPAAMCTPLGDQRTLVLLLTMPGVPAPTLTPAYISNMLFGTSGFTLNEFWRESSYGVTTASGDVLGWYTLDANYSCEQTSQIRDAAIRAVDSVVDFRQYSRIFLILSGVSGGCGWAGLATVGCSSLSSAGDGNFTASTSWMYSDLFSSWANGVPLAIHEGGHNLGLDHASSRSFQPEALGAPGSVGVRNEYGDEFSAMSSASFGHYAAPHKAKLGWFSSDVQTVTGNGSFSIQPTEIAGALHALKVRRGLDDNNWLWVEYRQPLGVFDSTLKSQIFGGGLIHYQDPTTGGYTELLDFTPNTTSWSDPALLTGQSWVDPHTNLSLNINSASPTALNVSVAYGPAACTAASPTISMSPANPSVYAGSTVNYTVTIGNNDSQQCAARTFSLSSLVPDWQTTFSQDSVVLAPSDSTSVAMSKLVPVATPPATYSVDALATSTLGTVDGSANVTVVPIPCTASTPAITLTSSVSTAFPGDTVDYEILIKNNDAGSCTPRTFNLSSSMPAGWATSFPQTSLTVPSASTVAVKMYKSVPSSASSATYSADVIATNGSSSVDATANIRVVPTPCTASAPVIALTSSVSTAFPGDTVEYAILIKNNDAGSCTSRTFNVSSSMPAGWATTFSQTSMTVPPASSASAKMSKIVPSSAAPGTYSANVVATDAIGSVDAKASTTVPLVSLAITLSTSGALFTRGTTVTITANVTQGSIRASGASVVFTMTSPNGATSTKKMTADSSGVAVWSYRVSPKDSKGSYRVSAQAKFGSQTAISTSVGFSVE